jgi:hypothetical protein
MISGLIVLALQVATPVTEPLPDASRPDENATSVASTPPADNRPILWQNIRFGMTVAEVRALYPQGQHERYVVNYRSDFTEVDEFHVVGECKAEINILHERGTVDSVVAKADGSLGGRCSDLVLTTLSSRYGQPLSDTREHSSILRREGRVYVWNRDGVTLRLKRFSNGVFSGGGLGSASWELTYTTAPDDVAL